MKHQVTKRWFGNWANEYDATLGKVRRHHDLLNLAVRVSRVKKGDHVLDLGCGTGLLSLKLLKRADCRITAADSSADMLKLFEEKIAALDLGSRIRCVRQDAAGLRFPKESFDIVAATVALHHVKNKLPMVKKIRSVLKPGGRFVLGEIDVDSTGDHADPKRLARMLPYVMSEIMLALKDGGVAGMSRMYDNGKKHILNHGEYTVSARQWKKLYLDAGFRRVTIHPVRGFRWFKVLVATR